MCREEYPNVDAVGDRLMPVSGVAEMHSLSLVYNVTATAGAVNQEPSAICSKRSWCEYGRIDYRRVSFL